MAADQEPVLFWGKESPFSNFHPCPVAFVVDGRSFRTTEHAFMAEKALEFNDHDALALIMVATTPLVAQQLGRKVRGYDDAHWAAVRRDRMHKVCLAKFQQIPEFREALLQTGDARIAEASPIDRIWGIGLRATHADARDPSKWRGTNLLGQVLEEVRAQLRGDLAQGKGEDDTGAGAGAGAGAEDKDEGEDENESGSSGKRRRVA